MGVNEAFDLPITHPDLGSPDHSNAAEPCDCPFDIRHGERSTKIPVSKAPPERLIDFLHMANLQKDRRGPR